jgi:hypothetical protein
MAVFETTTLNDTSQTLSPSSERGGVYPKTKPELRSPVYPATALPFPSVTDAGVADDNEANC